MAGDDSTQSRLSLSAIQRVNLAFDRFLEGWASGSPPRLETFLDQHARHASEPEQLELFRQLLDVELHHRRQNGDSPTCDEYYARFPDFEKQIDSVFVEGRCVIALSPGTVDGIHHLPILENKDRWNGHNSIL